MGLVGICAGRVFMNYVLRGKLKANSSIFGPDGNRLHMLMRFTHFFGYWTQWWQLCVLESWDHFSSLKNMCWNRKHFRFADAPVPSLLLLSTSERLNTWIVTRIRSCGAWREADGSNSNWVVCAAPRKGNIRPTVALIIIHRFYETSSEIHSVCVRCINVRFTAERENVRVWNVVVDWT